nr:hypothetical protein [uncultured Sphaerochaeta sp.]
MKELIKQKILQEIRLAEESISKRLSENIYIAKKEAPYIASNIIENKVLVSVKCIPNRIWIYNSIPAEFIVECPKISSISYMVAKLSGRTLIPESERVFEDIDDSVSYACELLGFVE